MNSEWACEKCTFINSGNDLSCIMCYYPQFENKDLDIQWQWESAEDEKWIPYDRASMKQIEEAFQDNMEHVVPSQGWFKDYPGYIIFFFDRHFKMTQKNRGSGKVRRVRRLAANDTTIYIPSVAPPKSVCCICHEEISNCVKLLPCSHHYFHLDCIFPWTQLHNNCPVCKLPLFPQ